MHQKKKERDNAGLEICSFFLGGGVSCSLQLQTTYFIINAIKRQIYHVHLPIVSLLQLLWPQTPYQVLSLDPAVTSVPQIPYAHPTSNFQTLATSLDERLQYGVKQYE